MSTSGPMVGLPAVLACILVACGSGSTLPAVGDDGTTSGVPDMPLSGSGPPAGTTRDETTAGTTADDGSAGVPSPDVGGGSTGSGPVVCDETRPVEIDGGCHPPVRPYAFHLIHKDFEPSWDAIAAVAETREDILITSQNRPEWLAPVRWAQRTSPTYHPSGAAMADAVAATLADADEAPAAVVVDELRTEHIGAIAEFAATMREQYPQWAGRWGVWIVHGIGVSYQGLQPAIDELLLADARLLVELYPAMSQYCSAASTAAGRDAWLRDYYRGGQGEFPQPRFAWLVSRREELGSQTSLSLAFGVTDTYLDRPGADAFLDRMFYVWRVHSGFGSLLFPDVGGVGAYKWHDHGPTTRDDDFVASYQHYALGADPSSRLGPVDCP